MSKNLSTEEVCGSLVRGGVDEKTVSKIFAARLEPENLDDPDKKFAIALPAAGDTAFLLVYRFGTGTPLARSSPLDEGGPDWRPRWVSVEGPFDDCPVEPDPMHPDRVKFTEEAAEFLKARSTELTSA